MRQSFFCRLGAGKLAFNNEAVAVFRLYLQFGCFEVVRAVLFDSGDESLLNSNVSDIVLIALGTSMHFVHELPFFNKFLGNIFPVNESVWEHMKMDFYPLLLAAIYLCIRKKDIHPFEGMILAGICAIPVQIILFYCYWPLWIAAAAIVIVALAHLTWHPFDNPIFVVPE